MRAKTMLSVALGGLAAAALAVGLVAVLDDDKPDEAVAAAGEPGRLFVQTARRGTLEKLADGRLRLELVGVAPRVV